MCIAAPGGILVIAAGVYSPLERISAFAAKYFSRKVVAILVFFLAFYNALFMASLLDQGGCSFNIFMADDGFMVAGKGIAIPFSIIRMTNEKNRNLVEKAVRDVASDMVVSPKVNGMEYGYADGAFSSGSMSDLISGISSAVSEALAGFSGPQGNIVIPVYVGGTLLDELVVTAQARQNLRLGGR